MRNMNPGKIFIKGSVHTHGMAVLNQGTIHHTAERNRVFKKIFVLQIMFTCASKTIAAWYYGAGLCESYMNKKKKTKIIRFEDSIYGCFKDFSGILSQHCSIGIRERE